MATIATFDVCACEKHGRIVIDRTPGDEIPLQRMALIATWCAFKRGLLSKEQAVALGREIEMSKLTARGEDIPAEVSHMVRAWNVLRKRTTLDPDVFHMFFEQNQL